MPSFAVKFLSGKYQGGEFPLPDDGEVIIGRASDLDMVLVEDMVSRKHAKIGVAAGKVSITDLGSTNGTFINGKKVRRADIKLGDRVLVGTNILKLIRGSEMTTAAATAQSSAQAQSIMEGMAAAAPKDASMSGELEDVPLPDLLQLFSTNQKSGTLAISGPNRGKLYLKDGQLLNAIVAGELQLPALKALCRMLTWTSGHFSMEPGEPEAGGAPAFTDKTESILLEGLRQVDEMRRIQHELPPPGATVALRSPLTPRLRDLKPEDLDVLQLVVNHRKLRAIVDRSSDTDYTVCKALHRLLADGYLEVTDRG